MLRIYDPDGLAANRAEPREISVTVAAGPGGWNENAPPVPQWVLDAADGGSQLPDWIKKN